MTKKDYELIAGTLRHIRPLMEPFEFGIGMWQVAVECFVNMLHAGNPKFQPDRFRAACHRQ